MYRDLLFLSPKTKRVLGIYSESVTDIQRSKEQNKFFPEGKASLMFSNFNELKKKILFIERNPKKALKIRKNGYRIAQKHTYTNRAEYILKKLYHDL